MIDDIADVDLLEICTQAGFMEPSATPKFSEKLLICKYSNIFVGFDHMDIRHVRVNKQLMKQRCCQ